MDPMTDVDDPRLPAAVELLGRTGAQGFQFRYCEEEEPVVWMAMAEYPGAGWQVAAAMNPLVAIFRLCDQIIDGGRCTHCAKPTGFAAEFEDMPLPEMVCWYQWDPELTTFRRGCE
jgi:hypothetical protein